MTTPISNTNQSLVNGGKSSKAEERAPHQAGAEAEGSGSAVSAPVKDDAVTVSRAAQVLNEAPAERRQGVIQTPEQAALVAQNIKNMFAEASGQALAAQAKGISPELIGLLKTG